MRIYVASSWRNVHQPGIVAFLRLAGHEVYDFRAPHLGPGARGVGFNWADIDPRWEDWTVEQYRDALTLPRVEDGYRADLTGMGWAGACVLLLPSGRSAHSEAGWMAGKGKPVIVHTADRRIEPELMYLLYHEITVTDGELLAALGGPA